MKIFRRYGLSRIEHLEKRIAPASLYLSGLTGDLNVHDSTGALVAGNTSAASAAGADFAIPLATDDVLIFDENGNHANDGTDFALVMVKEGSALVFVTHANGSTQFEETDVTGLAVSAGFGGKIGTDVNGSIFTALDDTGAFTASGSVLTLQAASISELNIDGQVVGNIFAGGSISNVIVTSQNFNAGADIRSVTGNIATGTAVNLHDPHLNAPALSFDHDGSTLSLGLFTPATGAAGGSITNVRLDHGAHNLITGNGGNKDAGVPGGGGKISNVIITMDSVDPVWLVTGNGGNSTTGPGGNGGRILNATVKLTVDATDNFEVIAGAGGSGGGSGNGGIGGAIEHCNFVATASSNSSIQLQGGPGGTALGTGAGGAGGSIRETNVQALGAGNDLDSILATAGDGGDSTGGHGGAGGGILDSAFSAIATIDTSFSMTGGNGGAGKSAGGRGGKIEGLVVLHRQATALSVGSGVGGDGTTNGGAGGDLNGVQISGSDAAKTDVTLTGGVGGTGSNKGGAGGDIVNTSVREFDTIQSLTLQSGEGAVAGTGGAGGNVLSTTVVVGDVVGDVDGGDLNGGVHILAGSAGKSSAKKGSPGGALRGVDVQNLGNVTDGFEIKSGDGGLSSGTGAGGNGGVISRLNFTNAGGAGSLEILTGDGGDAGTSGKGGTGGLLAHSSVLSSASLPSLDLSLNPNATLKAGTGGMGGTSAGTGGIGGTINDVELHDLFGKTSFLLTSGGGGTSSGASAGGKGGTIANVTGEISQAVLDAGGGGTSGGGTGGTGGAVHDVHFSAVADFVRALKAGDGGNGTKAGAGGSVSNIFAAGHIGDFTSNFDVTSDTSGMGGIVAGKKGTGTGAATNGHITNITADRIAAMIAGRADASAIAYTNAVQKISVIHASVIGADVDGDGTFDFVEGGSDAIFEPDDAHHATDGDTAQDGLVLVKASGLGALGVAPLKLVQV